MHVCWYHFSPLGYDIRCASVVVMLTLLFYMVSVSRWKVSATGWEISRDKIKSNVPLHSAVRTNHNIIQSIIRVFFAQTELRSTHKKDIFLIRFHGVLYIGYACMLVFCCQHKPTGYCNRFQDVEQRSLSALYSEVVISQYPMDGWGRNVRGHGQVKCTINTAVLYQIPSKIRTNPNRWDNLSRVLLILLLSLLYSNSAWLLVLCQAKVTGHGCPEA